LEETVRDVVLVCMPTHGTQVAIAAAAAVAWAIALSFQRHTSPLDILNGAEEAAYLGSQFGHQIIAPSITRRIAWVSDQISNQRDTEKSLVELYELFGGGVSAADSIPVALGVFAFCQGNPQQIILTASNMGGDTDTIGAISAAIGGVYSGDEAIPADWASMVQSTNQIDLTEIARSLVALASRWVPAGESQIPSLVQGGDV
jgi:ADP-ribosylglycohydrolase